MRATSANSLPVSLPGSFVGHTMRFFNLRKPISVTRASRVSPYYRTIEHTTADRARRSSFYCASASGRIPPLSMDRDGSTFELRIQRANEFLGHARLGEIDGYYAGHYGFGDTMQPIVALLPKSRGFLCGWTMGPGMCAVLDTSRVWGDTESAARAAHNMAEYDASEERSYRAREEEEVRRAEEEQAAGDMEGVDGSERDFYPFAGDI